MSVSEQPSTSAPSASRRGSLVQSYKYVRYATYGRQRSGAIGSACYARVDAIGDPIGSTFADVLRPGRKDRKGDSLMSGTTDKATGRLKEAAGALTDDDELRDEGKLDQAAGKVKDTAEKLVDKVRDAVKGRS